MRILVVAPVPAEVIERVVAARGGHMVDRCDGPVEALKVAPASAADLVFLSWDGSDPVRELCRALFVRQIAIAAVIGSDDDVDPAADTGASFLLRAPLADPEVVRVLALAERRLLSVAAGRNPRDVSPQLRLADRMAALGTLAAGVGHEINNPLTYIIGNLGLLGEMAEEIARDDREWLGEFQELVREINEGLARIRLIVRDLKTFAHPEEHRTQPIDVRRVMDAVVSMTRNEIRHRARIERQDDPEVPAIRGNQARVGQVFLNLVINAAQALPIGDAATNRIGISVRSAGDRVLVSVSDTGPGISRELHSRIFDPFFSTKEVGVGTGLGLAICHGIVTSMGGEIVVDSDPGHGATFKVWLPAITAREATDERPPPAPRDRAASARILIVDDEPGVVAMLVRALDGHTVVNAESGRAALARLVGSESFDLVLCDLMMPDMTGMDVFREVERQRPELSRRIAFITGGAFSPDAQEFLRSVDAPTLEKPFTMAELRTFVDGLLTRARAGAGAR